MNGRSEVTTRERKNKVVKTKQKINTDSINCQESPEYNKDSKSPEVQNSAELTSDSETQRRKSELKIPAQPSKVSQDEKNRSMSRRKTNNKIQDGFLSEYVKNNSINNYETLDFVTTSKSTKLSGHGNELLHRDDNLKSSMPISIEETAVHSTSPSRTKPNATTKSPAMPKSNKFKSHPIKQDNLEKVRTLQHEPTCGVPDKRVYSREHLKNNLNVVNPIPDVMTSDTARKIDDVDNKTIQNDSADKTRNKKKMQAEETNVVTDKETRQENFAGDSVLEKPGDQRSNEPDWKDEGVGRNIAGKSGKTILG